MLSSEGKLTDTNAGIANKKPKIIGTDDATSLNPNQQLDKEQIFRLIEEGILCFEACLYHRVLPLKLEYNSLLLGIVNPKDTVAFDYVNNILSYLKITVVSQSLASETHRVILSEYLHYKNALDQSKLSARKAQVDSKKAESVANSLNTVKKEDSKEKSKINENTLIFLDSSTGVNLKNSSSKKSSLTNGKIASTENLPLLRLTLPESFSSDEMLSTLPPKKLLAELLARILEGGIGRLYLERQSSQGRILWSLNGIVQSVVEQLPLSEFQGVLHELKRLSSLPIMKFMQAQHVEIECLYKQQRLLLRLRFMSGDRGEEATLQVLRGAALKFYQQQNLTRLSRDALGVSQQLRYKVEELQLKLALNKKDLNPEQLDALDSLNELVENLDRHLKILKKIPTL